LDELGDQHSERFYRLVAAKIPEAVIREAISSIRVDGAEHPAKLFTFKMQRYALVLLCQLRFPAVSLLKRGRIPMDVHASPAALPELEAFLSTFKVRFRRREARAALERYLTGLLTQLPNKNCDTLAQAVPGTHEQRLQGLLTTMEWDEEALNRQRVEKMIAEATLGHGVLIFDDTGFAKQGKASVGVARQYSGTLGKVGNCQVAVTCGYSDPQASWPVSVRLYLPEAWAADSARLKRTRVPKDVTFQTKPELGVIALFPRF